MAYDSVTNVLTIYGEGFRDVRRRGLLEEIEDVTPMMINHEIIHDIIYQLEDMTELDVWERHWPFYWGIDYMNGEWFTSLLERMKGMDAPTTAARVRERLAL